MKLNRYFALATLVILACGKTQKASDSQKTYFDIRGFFDKEAGRLSSNHPTIQKTVVHNNSTEQKITRDINWENELELFKKSDINKPSWKNSYTALKTADAIEYTAREPALRTRKIRIEYSAQGKIHSIRIQNTVKNLLYSSSEELVYLPDSSYSILKNQKVVLIGTDLYRIMGKILTVDRTNN